MSIFDISLLFLIIVQFMLLFHYRHEVIELQRALKRTNKSLSDHIDLNSEFMKTTHQRLILMRKGEL